MEDAKPKATLERVPISKLRARDINPRIHFGDLDDFAAEFDDNPVFPGEPWTPVMVYRDGNVYRIVDGERRYRAMKKAGKVKECNAYVFESMEDAVAVLVMLDTNSKQMLTAGEYSAGLQTALILGVPEEKVDARAGSKCAAVLKRQVQRQGGKISQLSIDRIIAADEFADDQEAYDEIMQADGDDWRYAARRLRNRRDEARNQAAAEESALKAGKEHGLQVVEKPPKGAILERTLYSPVAETIDKDGAEWARTGAILAKPRKTQYGYMTGWEVYSLPPERTPEEEAAAKSRNALRRQVQLGRKCRREWVARRMLDVGALHGLPNVRKFVRDYVFDNQMYDVDEFCKMADIDSDFFNDSNAYRIPSEYVIACYWGKMDYMTNIEVDAIGDGTAKDSAMCRHVADKHVKLLNAMQGDGYKPSEEELAFRSLCLKACC